MAAGLPGTTRETNTPLLWAETRRPTWRDGESGTVGTLFIIQYLAVTILAEDDPSREPGIDDRKRVAVGDQILNEELYIDKPASNFQSLLNCCESKWFKFKPKVCVQVFRCTNTELQSRNFEDISKHILPMTVKACPYRLEVK